MAVTGYDCMGQTFKVMMAIVLLSFIHQLTGSRCSSTVMPLLLASMIAIDGRVTNGWQRCNLFLVVSKL